MAKLASINPMPGDANGDGVINATDFSLAISVILQQGTASGSADCNRDNQVNVQDLVCMNSAIAGGGSPTGIATYFGYDEQGQLIGEYGGQGNPIEETVYFQGMPVATVQSGIQFAVCRAV